MQPGATTRLKSRTNRQLKNRHKYSDPPVRCVISPHPNPLPQPLKITFSDHDVRSFSFLLRHSISPSTALTDTALSLPVRRGCLLHSLWHLSPVCCWQQYNHLEEQTTIFNQWSCCSRHVSRYFGAFNCVIEASRGVWRSAATSSGNFRAVLNIFGTADRSQVSQAMVPARNYLNLGASKA